jgi:hypothetical protein
VICKECGATIGKAKDENGARELVKDHTRDCPKRAGANNMPIFLFALGLTLAVVAVVLIMGARKKRKGETDERTSKS